MKKIGVLFLLALIFASCSNDDEGETQSEGSIYGKWYQKESVINNVTFPYDDHEACGKDYIEFYDQNKVRSIDVWDCEEDLDWIGTFTKIENTLTLYNGAESRSFQIIELTTETFAYEYYLDDDRNGVEEHYVERFTRR